MIDKYDIILASKSAARRLMLDNVGLTYDAIPANINEEKIIKNSNEDILSITENLAAQKALHISKTNDDRLVIGSDQTLEFNGKIISKSQNIAQAKEKLQMLRGQTHKLNSSVCVVLNGEVIFKASDSASLTMHGFSDEFLDKYISENNDALISCVGGYKIEGAGAWLFSSVKGDFFTIMGMPLLPLLGFLRNA